MGKKYNEKLKLIEKGKLYNLEEGVDLVLKMATAKFDETIEVSIALGVDVKIADQMIRGTIVLPHGIGKLPRILVFAKGENEKIAKEAGANYVGFSDLIEKIEKGWLDFDVAIATPDIMRDISKLGKILGPRGLMPNPKSGTVTFNLKEAINEVKLGRIEFKTDKLGIVHLPIGKKSFEAKKIMENLVVLLETILHNKPSSAKGQFIKSVVLSSTMSPGVILNVQQIQKILK